MWGDHNEVKGHLGVKRPSDIRPWAFESSYTCFNIDRKFRRDSWSANHLVDISRSAGISLEDNTLIWFGGHGVKGHRGQFLKKTVFYNMLHTIWHMNL